MFGGEMNVFLSKKIRLLPLAAVVASLGGCVGSFDPQTDAASPLAPRIQQLVDSHNRYPRWEDFPKVSTDTPSAPYVGREVTRLAQLNQSLAAQVMGIDWTMNPDPSVFEAMVQRQFDPAAMAPIGPQTTAEIEALAESLRRKATPPPPIDRPRF
jgi:hypothetical protein